jgi:GxxExxY protein
MYILSEREELLCKIIVDCAFKVHSKFGPGLLEKIYEACFCYELEKAGVSYKRQVDLPIYYDNMVFDEGLRIDVLVDDLIICELKAVDQVNPIWQAQLISHLKLIELRVGFVINFNTSLIKDGIRRYCV